MSRLEWHKTGEKLYETGVDRGVLYPQDSEGGYSEGFAWNGLTAVTESPSGAEPTPLYADNTKYLNLLSVEEFGGTIEAYTYPDEFAECDGTASPTNGVTIGQQRRRTFGLAYRTLIGNEIDETDHGYKIHLIYGALAAPSERAYATVNDTPEAINFSWEVSTTPVEIPGFRPSSQLTIDSTKVTSVQLTQLEDILYGTDTESARLPLPSEVLSIFGGDANIVTPTEPTQSGNTVTIPSITGVEYVVDGNVVTGSLTIDEDTLVSAQPETGYQFPSGATTEWLMEFSE